MNFVELIEKKVANQAFTDDEVSYIINKYTNNQIPDYQMSALLMALVFQPLNNRELYLWTKAMMNSGSKINIKHHHGCPLIDKHSTGGIADTVSIIICPLLVSLGINIAKLSGKALGKTGGTIDKLLTIPNINLSLSKEEMQTVFDECGMFIAEQTSDLVPADKHIYNLRNVTATVKSMPLIASSILSKKFIVNSDLVLIDLKCGRGAFCETIGEAQTLAKIMLELAKLFHRKINIHITDMNSPLGSSIGNAIELYEAYRFLSGQIDKNTNLSRLIYTISAEILRIFNPKISVEEALSTIDQKINDKSALHSFYHWIKAQNGDTTFIDNLEENIGKIKYKHDIVAAKSGYFNFINAGQLGMIANELGANVAQKGDKIDIWAGIKVHITQNQAVSANQPLFTFYSHDKPISESAINNINEAFTISENAAPSQDLIIDAYKNYT